MPKAKKTQSAQDYRKLTLIELDKKLTQQRIRLQELRAQLSIGKLTDHQAIRGARKAIARTATIKREKLILEEMKNGESI